MKRLMTRGMNVKVRILELVLTLVVTEIETVGVSVGGRLSRTVVKMNFERAEPGGEPSTGCARGHSEKGNHGAFRRDDAVPRSSSAIRSVRRW